METTLNSEQNVEVSNEDKYEPLNILNEQHLQQEDLEGVVAEEATDLEVEQAVEESVEQQEDQQFDQGHHCQLYKGVLHKQSVDSLLVQELGVGEGVVVPQWQ